jgi:putative two-component system response regulator
MKPKLLIVDDDEMVLRALRLELEARYAIVATRRPDEALALARKERPDLVLCDLDMPGMDGGDVSAALFADDAVRDIPVLFLTALALPGDQVGGRAALAKDTPIEQLIARIESLLQK